MRIYLNNVVLLGLAIMPHHQSGLNSNQEKPFLFFSCYRRSSKRPPKQAVVIALAAQRLRVSPHCWRRDALQTQALRKWATSDPKLPLPEDQLSAQKGAMQAATWGRGKQSSYPARMPTSCNDDQHGTITLTLMIAKRYLIVLMAQYGGHLAWHWKPRHLPGVNEAMDLRGELLLSSYDARIIPN